MKAKYKASTQESTFEGSVSADTNDSRTVKIAATVVAVILLLGVVGVIVYFAAFHNSTENVTTSATPPITTEQPQPSADKGLRVDCLVDQLNKTEDECKRRNCAWDDEDGVADGDKCSVVVDPLVGNMLREVREERANRKMVRLSWEGEKVSLFSKLEDIITNIDVQIDELDTNMLRITFFDVDDPNRYKVPIPLKVPKTPSSKSKAYEVSLSDKDKKFYLRVTRKSDNTEIFNTRVADLVMEKQYLSLSTVVPSGNVYGLGENLHKTFKHQFSKAETWAMFARDQPPGQDPDQHYDNLYGVHPFYVCIEKSGNAHGVFLLNSNAQDVTLTPGHMITYRTIGGILDFFIFTGPSPENVVQQYTGLIGRPYMPPYWSLGFQLCRYGYKNTEEIKAVVEDTRRAGIPHDVQYADIDYMDGRKDFTIDPVNFGNLSTYFRDLQANHNMKIIIILDPAISIEAGYPIYPEGDGYGIFIKWPKDSSSAICDGCADDSNNMLGYVWPDNKTAFPDFFKSSTKEIWRRWVVKQSKDLYFDGLWIDMNEPAAFDTNKDEPWNWEEQRPNESAWNLKCDMTHPLENPPYKTKACHLHATNEVRNISDKTLCMVALHGVGDIYTHYNVHNLYGWSQTKPTLLALRDAVGSDKRGMVISRSTFAGSGQHAGHWLGDNSANWQHLRESIIGMLEFNLFGIPYVGADICGFFGNSTESLCKRWMQLGAFYPFARNHNGKGYNDHHPTAFDDELVANLSRSSLETRYSLLPYLYTLFYRANMRGDTVVRSLQFEWPKDAQTLDISEQFLWGGSILFSPILYEDQREVTAYVPTGRWYDYYNQNVAISGGNKITIPVDERSEIPIHVRGGSIIPMKEAALTTTDSRRTAFKLLAALDDGGRASGELFWDDGETIDTKTTSCFVKFAVENQALNSTVTSAGCPPDTAGDNSLIIDTVRILGAAGNITTVLLGSLPAQFRHVNETLVVHNLTQSIADEFSIQWS